MNMDAILTLVPSTTIFFFLMGVYKTTMEKKVQAKENIQGLLGRKGATDAAKLRAQEQAEVILRRRNKDEKSALFKLENKLERANLMLRPQEFFIISLVVGVLSGLLVMLFGQPAPLAILGGVGGCFLPMLYLNVRIWLRMKRAGEQFADVLDQMVNCFKTGYGFNRAIQVIADSYDDPWGTEFGKMAGEMSLGSNQETALMALSNRMPSPDVDLFVTALLIQKETGGNMAELLANLSKTCRERYKLFRKVGAISAQGKLSAGIVICVPFFLMSIMYVFLPGPVTDFITNPIGIVLMVVAGFWMCCGIGVLFKIVQIDV